MEPGALVVVHCTGPREKFWGVLLSLTAAGATVRAVSLDSFDDFLRQFQAAGPVLIGPATMFLPAHRIERIEVDESAGAVEGFGVRFERVTGRKPGDALLG